jgi:NAD(P)-dependent dehydrogenase (short-subunit alcohol dehydrogenase family)
VGWALIDHAGMNATALKPIPAIRHDLAGKVAVIVGAGGESAAAAAALASAGAAVTLAGADEPAILRAARAIRGSGGQALAIPTDLGEPRALRRLIETTTDAFGRLDLAVNSPGAMTSLRSRLRRAGQIAESGCRAVYLAMRYELPAMVRSGGGVVVNSALSRSEEAECVIGLTRAAALDHADRGVRINAIAYGPGTPEDFAAAALWLCSERAVYVNGGVVPVGLRAAAV